MRCRKAERAGSETDTPLFRFALISIRGNIQVMHLFTSFLAVALLALLAALTPSHAEPLKRIEEREFGKLADGASVRLFTLRNANGLVAKVMAYGAILTELHAPDRRGVLTNVVLGADNLH